MPITHILSRNRRFYSTPRRSQLKETPQAALLPRYAMYFTMLHRLINVLPVAICGF
ncbi:Uncharacterised protein [Yersinia frederiksenii]|nr:Uncharacterised protein [Yersinia frederiksenii]CNJ18421.1 Uncharacterised protein [Yersinia frederiksenii]CNL14982.1 Uncharacterised protein [Yersinia frederiksenii]